MKKIYLYFTISCIFLFVTGCIPEEQKNTVPYSNDIDTTENNVEINYTQKDDIWTGDAISINEAVGILSSKMKNEDINRQFVCESVDFYNERCYYIFRCIDNLPNHTVTVGWYAVDVLTGSCYDTIAWVDLVPID